MQKVKIRYLGKSLLKGRPKREFIVIQGQKFWNCRRFKEQLPDLSYLRPIEFYERNKTILDNKHLFILEFADQIENPTILQPESENKKSKIDFLYCSDCTFKTRDPEKLRNHIETIHKE